MTNSSRRTRPGGVAASSAKQRDGSKQHRSKTGSMLVLIVCVTAVVFIPVLILVSVWGPHFIKSERAKDVVEAAGKIAAIDLSRIVIRDSNFGYVSLSNYQPVGKATCATDGEPLPVTSINTLVGTLRQNAIIADELHNDTMNSLVDKDFGAMKKTINNLNTTFNDSLNGTARKGTCIDINGAEVTPVADVEKFLSENLPQTMQVESVKLSLGWLDGGSETCVPVPHPVSLARVSAKEIQSGQYNAFTIYPIGNRAFSFAGLATQTHLVPIGKFREDDGHHICSVVKIECNLVSSVEPRSKVQWFACCQGYTHEDRATRGAMTIRFTGRPVPGLLSWSEFLSIGSFRDNKVTTFDVVNGDFPFNKEAAMKQFQEETEYGTSGQFAEHLYYWLRNGRSRPRMDAILAMINEPFATYPNQVHTYEFADDGSIIEAVIDGHRFTRSVTADGQVAAIADTHIRSGASAIIFFRDNVTHLSAESGKHGGQPLAGYPLGTLDGCVDYEQLSLSFSKRSENTRGLALDIEIGGTGDSTAGRDVISMRERTRSRKI